MTRPLTPAEAVNHCQQNYTAEVKCHGGCGRSLKGEGETPISARTSLRSKASIENWILILKDKVEDPYCLDCAISHMD